MQSFNPGRAPGVYDPARPHEIQAFLPGAGEHYVLPGDVTKAQAIATATAVLPLLKATPSDILVFRKIADMTERTAWHDPARAPVNWRRQCDMARELGLGERQFRNIEKRLERFGVLARATADNGYRGRRAGQGYRDPVSCGLSLEPAIANYPAFVEMLAMAEVREGQRQEVILHLRTAKRRVRQLIEGIGDREIRCWAEEAHEDLSETFPADSLRGLEIEDLDTLHAALLDLETRIRRALEPLVVQADPGSEPPCPSRQTGSGEADAGDPVDSRDVADSSSVEKTGKQQDISAAPEMDYRSHIQPQINHNESCNDQNSSISTPAYAGDRYSSASPPNGNDACFEKKNAGPAAWINPAILQSLTPEALRDLASEDAALYLDAVQDWRECLPYLLRELGVNVSAWIEACDVMGDETAFIALLVIDRNRFHPVTPVINPGGALRAFTERARRGELNLTRAILGIRERDRQGRQPKAAPRTVQ